MSNNLYPLKFSPVLKDKIWGGSKLQNDFGKISDIDKLGESWELSGYEGDESIVSNGFLTGKSINEILKTYTDQLVGAKIFTEHSLSFPLLFKLIDANDNLSIQVHPNDEVAALRHNSKGKTEMWYVVDAENDAKLTVGFNNECSKSDYLEALSKGEVESLLNEVPVSAGDVFFIPAGLVHAIGKGIVIAEIQQSSDITYRIYDYKRTDDKGNERELHTEQALDVIDFSASIQPKTIYKSTRNEICELVKCNYFTTNILEFNESVIRDYSDIDSFVIYMCLSGSFTIQYAADAILVEKGDTVMIPACLNQVKLIPSCDTKLLEVYI